jgi:hypothetical protein
MTGLGKFLTYVNILFAVTLMAWSVSAYANRVNYLDYKDGTESKKGQISQLKEEIDKLQKSAAEAQAAYGARASELVALEGRRDYRYGKLQARLAEARGIGGRQPLFMVQLDEASRVADQPVFTDVDRVGPGINDIQNKPLRGLKVLQEELEAEIREQGLQLEGQQKLNAQQKAQLLQQVGQPAFNQAVAGMGIAELRETQGRLSDAIADTDLATEKQRFIRSNLADETSFLADKRVNWLEELRTLERRHAQLEAEIRRLGGTP